MEERQEQPVAVSTVLAAFLDQLAAIAWSKLGLQPDPLTGAMAKNLSEAKVAIDAAADLSKHLLPALDDQDRREVENLIRDLRLNYMNFAKELNS